MIVKEKEGPTIITHFFYYVSKRLKWIISTYPDLLRKRLFKSLMK